VVEFIGQHHDEPFFLYYPTTNIHFPLTPHPRFRATSKAGVYGDFVVEFDWAVGEVLNALDRHRIADKTMVIVTSDNGARPTDTLNGHACNGSWRGTKRMIYEGGHRVPLIVRWPGRVAAGVTAEETVCLTDFFATFAGMLESDPPESAGEDSFDLMPVLRGEDCDGPIRPLTIHHSVCGQFAIREGDWKLIEGAGNGDFPRTEDGKVDAKRWNPVRDSDSGEWTRMDYFNWEADDSHQLFHLGSDPGEKHNLADREPERVRRMLRRLQQAREAGRTAP
jgi:arylsulfatase A